MGEPSVFVRLSLCNLHCVWCDTPETWLWVGSDFKHDYEGENRYERSEWIAELTPQEVADRVREAARQSQIVTGGYQAFVVDTSNCKRLVISGGEPMLQQRELLELMELLPDFFIEIETNGTIAPRTEAFRAMVDQFNVSPKLSNSGNSKKLREKKDALAFFAGSEKAWFKFVICTEKDMFEAMRLIKKYNIDHDHVFLMPEGWAAEQLNEKKQWIAEFCKQYGFRFTDRLHVQIWGKKRGT